ncbi:MAG: PIN domain-containing protein [Chlorobi bacterium]|nr:PIN domain-containing protein [Chlorobiota bacterium]
MTKVFLDTNVILDFFLKRKSDKSDHYRVALNLINYCISANLLLYVSILSLKDVYYISAKITKGQNEIVRQNHIKQKINDFLRLINLTITTDKAFYNAMNSDFKDFEDALQYFTARENDINFMITGNKKDFILSEIPVYSPKEFLNLPIV